MPLVSIITPSFNSAAFLESAIQSVINQNYANLEHLVIDGGSTDDTLKILKRYESFITWVSEPDEGQADALNKGFLRAQGDIIGWLNADDTYQPGAIQDAVCCLQQHPDVSLVYGNFNFIDEAGQIIYTHCTPRYALEKLLYANVVPNAGMFFRRHLITELGGVNPRLHYTLDWDFVLRIALHYKVFQVPDVWGNFRITLGTKSVEQTDRFWPEIISVLQGVAFTPGNPLNAHKADSLFWAHLLGAVEFARVGQLESAKRYLGQALTYEIPPLENTPHVAVALIETATHPWHRAFREHPASRQTLTGFSGCLGDSTFEQYLKVCLDFYGSLLDLRSQNWNKFRALLSKSWPYLPKTWLLRPPMVRLLLRLILSNAIILRARHLKNRFLIENRRFSISTTCQ